MKEIAEVTLKKESQMEYNTKYELLKDDTLDFYENKLYRVRALKNFGNVKKGTLGGYIESEKIYLYTVTHGYLVTQRYLVTHGYLVTLIT